MSTLQKIIIVVVFLLCLVAIGVAAWIVQIQKQYEGVGSLTVYCIDVKYNPPLGFVVKDTKADCTDWVNATMQTQRNTVLACYRNNRDSPALFKDCMASQGIVPPGVVRP